MRRTWIVFMLAIAGFILAANANSGTTLEKIKAANSLTCGIDTEEPEYST